MTGRVVSLPEATARPVDAYPPISDYALLSNCHSAALVSRDGSVDWCCFHRFDARPVFARLLDWRRGGHFRAAAPYQTSRRYLPETKGDQTPGPGPWCLTDARVLPELAR